MAANFQPAQPFSSAAYAAAGAGPIIDRQIEFQLQQQVAAQNRNQQAAIAALQAQTALNENSNNNDAAKIRQQFDLNASQRAQAAQFEQQRQMQYLQMQEQNQQNMAKMALWDVEVGHQEMQQQAQRQAGLAEIYRQLENKTITMKEAAPAIIELSGAYNYTKARYQNQQAAKLQAAAAMQNQQIADSQKNDAMAAKFQIEMAQRGITVGSFKDPHTGAYHLISYDPINKVLYNPNIARPGSAKGGGSEMDAEFSYKKAVPEAKAEAETAYPVVKEVDEKTGKERDINARNRAEYFQEVMKKNKELHEQKYSGQQSQSAQPTMQAQQQAEQPPAQQATPEQQKKLEQTVQAISQMPIPDQKKSELLKVNSQINELMQIPKDKMTFEQRQQFFMLYDRLKTLSGG